MGVCSVFLVRNGTGEDESKGQTAAKKKMMGWRGKWGRHPGASFFCPKWSNGKANGNVIALLSVYCAKSIHGPLTWSNSRPLRSVL